MAEMRWRKMPLGIIRDENLLYISEKLPKELSYAPWMFYYTALSIADNDGIFDLEDGVVFARLMKVDSPAIVFQVATLMMQRNIILHTSMGSNKCIFANWEYKDSESRTMDQRRQIVNNQIEEANKRKKQQYEFTLHPENLQESANFFNVDFSGKPSANAFFCSENDKNAENVAINFYDDKNAKNVVKTEREKEREIERQTERKTDLDLERDREKDTHREKQPLQAPQQAFRGCEEENKENTETAEQQTAEEIPGESATLAEQALSMGKGVINEQGIRTYGIFKEFFAKNCLGFNDVQHKNAMHELVDRVSELASEQNPADVIAMQFCTQFKKLCTESDFYKGQLISPENLLKNGAYTHVLAAVSQYLLNNSSNRNTWEQQAKKYWEEAQAEKAFVGDACDNEYVQFGIDPKDPNRFAKLMHAKSANQENNPP